MRNLLAILLLALASLVPVETNAQSCTADVQCTNGGRPRAECIGDTLIVRRSVCSGQCRDIEERRQNCAPVVVGGRCTSGGFERIEGRCNSSSASCDQRANWEPCLPSCSCRGKRLTVSTGQCSPAIGCHRNTIVCKAGCTCDPTPRCLDS